MVKNHLKTNKAPTTWSIKRKNVKFITRPLPGKQMRFSMPLVLVFKNLLNKVTTTKEVKYILNNQEVLVDGKRKYDVKNVVGLMDVLTLKKSKENFRISLNEKGKLIALSIDNKEAEIKLLRIENKTLLKKGVVQLNFSDGSNLIVKKGTYKTGDTAVINLSKKEVKEIIPLEKGVTVMLLGGKFIGQIATVVEIKEKVMILESNKNQFETKKQCAFAIGKDKPIIKTQ